MTVPNPTKNDRRPDGRALVHSALLGAAAAGALWAGAAAAGTRAVGAAAAAPPPTAPALASPAPSALQPETIAQAQSIRAQTEARYRPVPGRKLTVAEASSKGQVGSLTLATGGPEIFRTVATENGVSFSICSVRARCPYPSRSAGWPAAASLPRRQALELAVRTFRETAAPLVVVALPTAAPLWVVFERDDLLADAAAETPLVHLADDPAVADRLLRESVDRLVWPRLHRPVPILPPTLDTIVAIPYGGP